MLLRDNTINKRGSVTILLVLVFIAMMVLLWAFIWNSKEIAIEGGINQLGQVWGNSVLGEYDRNLLKRYNIFAFYGYEPQVNNSLKYYVKGCLKDKEYIDIGGIRSNLSGYSMTDIEVFSNAVSKAWKLPIKKTNGKEEKQPERQILNKKILKGLPSYRTKDTFSISGITSRINNGELKKSYYKGSTRSVLMRKYAFEYFNNYLDNNINPGSYLRDEWEYLLSGKNSDDKNLSSFKSKYIGIRNGLNLIYLYKSPEKRKASLALAEMITPGPEAVITQAVLMEAWALLEANNDWKLIINGAKVPLIKDDDSWAIGVNALKEDDYQGYVDPENEDGLDYNNTLQILLAFKGDDIIALRMMDLIQINMRFNYYNDFLLKEYNVGLDYKIQAQEKDYDFTKEY